VGYSAAGSLVDMAKPMSSRLHDPSAGYSSLREKAVLASRPREAQAHQRVAGRADQVVVRSDFRMPGAHDPER